MLGMKLFSQRAVRRWHICPEKLWCPIPGSTEDQVGWGPEQPCLVRAALPTAGGWNWMIFNIPSNLSHSVLLAAERGTAYLSRHFARLWLAFAVIHFD